MIDIHADIHNKLALLRESYTQQLPHKYGQIAQAWRSAQDTPGDVENLATMHRMAHSLTGSGATFGFDEVSTTARILEKQLKALLGTQPIAVSRVRDQVDNALQALQLAIQAANSSAPTKAPAAIPAPAQMSPVVVGDERIVFIIEDDAKFAEEVVLQLRHYGYTARVFPQIAGVEEALAQTTPVALIVDLLLPDGNSAVAFAAARVVQTWQVPLIFVSSRADFFSRLQAVRAGGSAYFTKPLDIGTLMDSLDTLTNIRPAEDFRVLVVDDTESVAKYHASILEQAGMQVMICTDPTGIMQPLVELNPDLILMDVYMSDCSGFEIATVLRQQEVYLSTPIVFLSSETDITQQLTALGLGADDYLTKPIDPQRLVAVVRARVQRARTMRGFIERDGLTGLLNHANIKDVLEREMALSTRNGTSLAFIIIDLDRFKTVNDTYGHQAGDRVLKSLARFLQQRLRETDYVGRYGGEEFALILPDTDGETARIVLEKLRIAFSELLLHAGAQSFKCTFSGGISVYRKAQTLAALIKAADQALYEAKNAGRNRSILAQ